MTISQSHCTIAHVMSSNHTHFHTTNFSWLSLKTLWLLLKLLICSKSKSHYDWRSVSQSVSLGVEPHLRLMARYSLLFDSYGLVVCGTPSLTRGRVCLMYMLLALASAVFLVFECLGTLDYILLSQIWDFSFRRLLRFAGSRWRYSTPPPYGYPLTVVI
jgi:hypothetical protein